MRGKCFFKNFVGTRALFYNNIPIRSRNRNVIIRKRIYFTSRVLLENERKSFWINFLLQTHIRAGMIHLYTSIYIHSQQPGLEHDFPTAKPRGVDVYGRDVLIIVPKCFGTDSTGGKRLQRQLYYNFIIFNFQVSSGL